jgi:hypothetical protein
MLPGFQNWSIASALDFSELGWSLLIYTNLHPTKPINRAIKNLIQSSTCWLPIQQISSPINWHLSWPRNQTWCGWHLRRKSANCWSPPFCLGNFSAAIHQTIPWASFCPQLISRLGISLIRINRNHQESKGNVHIIRNNFGGRGGVGDFVTKPCKKVGICTVFCYEGKGVWKSEKWCYVLCGCSQRNQKISTIFFCIKIKF